MRNRTHPRPYPSETAMQRLTILFTPDYRGPRADAERRIERRARQLLRNLVHGRALRSRQG